MILKRFFLSSLFFFLATLSAWSADLSELLSIDRFHYYLTELAQIVEKRGNPEIAKELRKIKPEQILKAAFKPADLGDATKYDLLARKMLEIRGVSAPPSIVKWDYPFYKNKLNEGYVLRVYDDAVLTPPTVNENVQPSELRKVPSDITADELTLDADHYISNRTTRAVFWDMVENGSEMEFHLGTAREFSHHLDRTGTKVVGEVKTLARNYNPIYLVQYPGESTYRIAFTEISGGDRLDHLIRQISITEWKNKTGNLQRPKVSVFGDVKKKLLTDQAVLARQLLTMPKADYVIIGQKGALERASRTASKLEAIQKVHLKAPTKVAALLDPSELKILENSKNLKSDFFAFKDAAKWDKIYEKLEALLKTQQIETKSSYVSASITNASHEIEDYLYQDLYGKTKRLRVISNTWGDEVVPIVKALKDTDHKRIFYIGTAGAFPDKGIEVGDLVAPHRILSVDGTPLTVKVAPNVPELALLEKTVAHVGSPFEESEKWLKNTSVKADLVEIETAYLAQLMRNPDDELYIYLLVSDIVGSESETLAQAESGARKGAQVAALNSVFEEAKMKTVASSADAKISIGKVEAIIDEALPGKDLAWRYQLGQQYKKKKNTIPKLTAENPSFTTTALEKRISAAQRMIEKTVIEIDPKDFKLHVDSQLIQGTFHPKKDTLTVYLETKTVAQANELVSRIEALYQQDPTLKKILTLKAARGPPTSTPSLALIERIFKAQDDLLWIYADAALRNAGVSMSFSSSGKPKFTRLPQKKELLTSRLLSTAEVTGLWVTDRMPNLLTCAEIFLPAK